MAVTVVIGAHDGSQNITGVPELDYEYANNPSIGSPQDDIRVQSFYGPGTRNLVTINKTFSSDVRVYYAGASAFYSKQDDNRYLELLVDGNVVASETYNYTGTYKPLSNIMLFGYVDVTAGSHTFTLRLNYPSSGITYYVGGNLVIFTMKA